MIGNFKISEEVANFVGQKFDNKQSRNFEAPNRF